MQQYHNAFISSTSVDLAAHRRAVIDILPQDEIHAINMEGFSATRDNALQLCYDELQRADIFIGIYAYRYGFAPGPDMTYTDKDGKRRAGDGVTGITDWEYRWAVERGIPLLLYVIETDSWNPAHMDDDKTAIEGFKRTIGGKHVFGKFNEKPESLAALVARDINKTLRDMLRPSPELAQAQERHALTLAQTRQQAEARQPKTSARYVGTLPRQFRRHNTPFHDRLPEQKALRDAIAARERLVTIYGRGGVGKTGLACYVIEELEHTAGAVDGMVYRSLQTGSVTINEIVQDFGRIVPLTVAAGMPPAEQIAVLLDALRDGHYVLLLDNFETAQEPDEADKADNDYAIREPSLRLLVETVLECGGLTLIITTRYPFPLDFTLGAYQTLIPLEDGLPLREARDFMRGLKGSEHLPDDDGPLDRLIERTRGFPRALEAAMGWLSAARGRRQLDDLLEDAVELDKVTGYIVEKAIEALPVNLRQVLDALAVCRETAPYDLLEYLLAPFRDQTAYPLRAALEALIDGHFVVEIGGRYGLHPLDREHCRRALPAGAADDDTFSLWTLNQRAIAYYRSRRKPQAEWRTLDDLGPPLMEFEHPPGAGGL